MSILIAVAILMLAFFLSMREEVIDDVMRGHGGVVATYIAYFICYIIYTGVAYLIVMVILKGINLLMGVML